MNNYIISGYGIDISEKMIKNAKANCIDMEFRVAGCNNIAYSSSEFNIVTVCVAFHYFTDAVSFFIEALKYCGKTIKGKFLRNFPFKTIQ